MEPDCDDEDYDDHLYYIDPPHQNFSVVDNHARGTGLLTNMQSSSEKTLGTWFFDKRHRQRKYIALTGKVYTGGEAMKAARIDQNSEKNPTKTIRYELKHLVGTMASHNHILEQLLCLNDPEDSSALQSLIDWGVPSTVVARYSRNKVTRLFQWQISCLTVDNCQVLSGQKHLIYSAPTSGGKTLVSEILMLRRLSCYMPSHTDVAVGDGALLSESQRKRSHRHTVFFVVPFVALAEEKAAYFQEIWQDMNIGVKAFHGDGGDVTGNILAEDVEVAVCTIERANILLTQLLDEGREDQLKMVVIDEIHMLTDSHRGFLLEVMLSKIKYLLNDTVQIVGMSATLPNIADLAGWLGASLFTTKYRPVDLEVKVCMDKNLYTVKSVESAAPITVGTSVTTTSTTPITTTSSIINTTVTTAAAAEYIWESAVGLLPEDPDGMKRLCLDTIVTGKSAMLFCNSKRRCEVCAGAIAQAISKHIHHVATSSTTASSSNHYHLKPEVRAGRLALIESLSQTQVGICPVLRETLPAGVAYHHAGLTLDERKIVEDGFRAGLVQVLCTTSTLSAGVNMPAHRVIIRSPRMGDKFLNVSGFRQMCGRAGRMGLDAKGEAILMIMAGNKSEKNIADHLMTADLDPLSSSLHIGAGGGLEKLLLEMISCGRLQNEGEVMRFISCTLMSIQQDKTDVLNYTRDALVFLKKEQFVQGLSDGQLSPSPLGIATTVSGIAPKDAVQVLKPLMDARCKIILKGGLHPVFLVTPPSTPIEPEWKNYEKVLHVLYQEHPDAEAVATYLGIERGQLCTYAFQNPPRIGASPKAQLYRRFFSAILLFTLVQEWPITRVTRLITHVTRGQLQQLQKDAAVFCGMTVIFCRKLNWPMLASCLEDFSARLNYGVHKDILALVRLGPEITAARARALLKNGIESALDILHAGVEVVTEIVLDSLPYDGRDPLQAHETTSNITTTTTATTTTTTTTDTTRSGTTDSSRMGNLAQRREASRAMCERLARKIISRAHDYVKDEAARLLMQQAVALF